jgi:hypothetical protein
MDQDVSKGRHMARGEERQQSLSELKRDAERAPRRPPSKRRSVTISAQEATSC